VAVLNCLLLTPSDRHPLHSLPLTPLLLLLHHITYLPHHYIVSSTVMPFLVALPRSLQPPVDIAYTPVAVQSQAATASSCL